MADAIFDLLSMFNHSSGGSAQLLAGTVTNAAPLEVDAGGLIFSAAELRCNAQYSPEKEDVVLMITTDYQLCHIICKEVSV